jgi:hypothetical protein
MTKGRSNVEEALLEAHKGERVIEGPDYDVYRIALK